MNGIYLLNKKYIFDKNISCMIYLLFIIAKELAISWLGGEISTQIVQYGALFIIGFIYFLCTNQLQ